MRGPGLLLLLFACTPESRLDRVTAEPSPAARIAAAPAVQATPAGASSPAAATSAAVDAAPPSSPSVAPGASPALAPIALRRPEATPPGVITAGHDAPIATLAATDDGKVVVSLDRRGGMRLWPSLDGAHAPVIVRGEAVAEQVAIARDGDQLVIAAAGPLGQLELIRTSALGEPVAHQWIDLARSVVALDAAPGRFVGLLDDQAIVAINLRGERIERLAPRAGERVVAMASRRGAVLAFVNVEGSLRARWIEAGDTLAWGGESAALRIDPEHAVLAPDHRRVAALTRDHNAIVIVELASGRTLERPVVMDFVDPARQPLGFLDDHTLEVQTGQGTLGWWRRGELTPAEGFVIGAAVATDRYLITASASSLALDTPSGKQRLGFRVVNLTSAQPRGNGWTVSDGAIALGLDDQLRARRRYPPRDGGPDYGRSLITLDGRRAVMGTLGGMYLFDLEHPGDGKLLSSMAGTISYEPTTHLLAIFGDAGLWLGHYNPRTHDIDAQLDLLGEARSIVLLDPELNHGNVALMLVQHDQTAAITEIRKVEFGAARPLREGRTSQRTLSEDPWGMHGDLVTQLGISATGRHHASPDGALVAVADGDRITLRDRQGAVRWSVALPGVVDVGWSALGELIAFGSGMARVDVGTGALLERRCGWDFGLWPDDAGFETGAKLCEAP
jgi:hypothetical protein